MAKQFKADTIRVSDNITLSAAAGDLKVGDNPINSIRRSAVKLNKSHIDLQTSLRKSAVKLNASYRSSAVKLNKSHIDLQTSYRRSAVKLNKSHIDLQTSLRRSAVKSLDNEVMAGNVAVDAGSESKTFAHGMDGTPNIVASLSSSSANAQIYAMQQTNVGDTNVTFVFSEGLAANDTADAPQTWTIKWMGIVDG